MTTGGRDSVADPATRSRWADIDGPVHYLDFGGPADGPVMVCVHGFGGSAVNWSAIAPLLTDRYRLLALDLAGHGLTRSAGRGTDVASNRILLHRFIESVPHRPVVLMGNSMGGMISLLEAGTSASSVAALILVDPALPFVPARPDPLLTTMLALYATPGVGRIVGAGHRRVPPEVTVAITLALCCADAARVPADIVAEHVRVARKRAAFAESGRDMATALRSVIATAGYLHGQEYRRRIGLVTCPVLLLHGAMDRLVPVGAASAAASAHPAWSVEVLPGVGHLPQLEAPADCARAIRAWLEVAHDA
jgi:pimeloyl-ACP methyl ester carboxylesterase